MTSEVENLLKGNIEKTTDFEANRKLIGVANENLMPNASGIIPLAKQSAYDVVDNVEKPNVETNTEQNQLNETINSMSDSVNSMSTPNDVKSLENNTQPQETILSNPVSVENSNILSSFSEQQQESVTPVVEPEKKEPILDLQMPQIPNDNIAIEPEKVEEKLFAGIEKDTNKEITDATEISKNDNTQTNSTIQISEIEQLIDQAKDKLKNEIEIEFEEIKKAVVSKLNNEKNENKQIVEQESKESNSLVDEALNQINNMVIPTVDKPVLQTNTSNNQLNTVDIPPVVQGVDNLNQQVQIPTINL